MPNDAVCVIERVLAAGILEPDLVTIPRRGATDAELLEEERRLGRALYPAHRRFLARWNGLDLEMVQVYGCGPTEPGLHRLLDRQTKWPGCAGFLTIGSDPAGFVYLENDRGQILHFDTDGGDVKLLASDLDDFFGRLVFGKDAMLFAGEEWAKQLRDAGLLP